MERILGQDRAVGVLREALASGRLHHAWIFSGPRGVGKFTTAKEFAKILLDPDAGPNLTGEIQADPAGRAAPLVDSETHPDLHVIRKELALFSDNPQLRSRKLSNIPLDVLREHVIGGKTSDERYHEAPAYRTPALGHAKVFIFDEAELIDRNGQNALLKTLEEPPPRTYLLLVTSRSEWLLPTVHSRCQHVHFGPLDEHAMKRWLEVSGLDLEPGEREWVEQFGAGSPGVAQLAAEYGFHRWQQTLEPMIDELQRGGFPTEMGRTMAEFVDDFANAWVKANRNASKDAANKDGARHLLTLLASHARARLAGACRSGGDPAMWLGSIDVLRDAERALEANVNLKQVMEHLVVQWARLANEPAAVV
jgi:DNA polymerase-3 subunit delta'